MATVEVTGVVDTGRSAPWPICCACVRVACANYHDRWHGHGHSQSRARPCRKSISENKMKDVKRKCAVPARGGGKPDLMVCNLAETCRPDGLESVSNIQSSHSNTTLVLTASMCCRTSASFSDAWCTPLACQRTYAPIRYAS